MPHKVTKAFYIFFFLILLFIALWAVTAYYENLPENVSQHEMLVFGQNRLVPESQAALRVVVRDSKDASPLAGAQVTLSLRPRNGGRAVPVYEGSTDQAGTANVSFRVPAGAAPEQDLIIETKSRLGSERVERPVTLERDYRILLTTDKPIYQPGQVIHVRALALSTFDLSPAVNQELEVIIADGKGNKVFRKKLPASEFGVAAADFQLASQVNTGEYKITASLYGSGMAVNSEKTVRVEHYVLPKFAVDLKTERSFYLPGQHVKGSLQANYFFGKPVARAEVLLEGYTYDVQRNVLVSLQGQTDEGGNFEFEFDLPSYIAGSELEGGSGRFYLQASVTDQAKHSETSNQSLPVSQSSLVIEAMPEGGRFRPGVENILYLLTSYPDGTPAETELSLTFYDTGETVFARTGPYGVAEVPMTPQNPWQQFTLEAHDTQGNSARRDFAFEGEFAGETVLLRPDRPVYQAGETMNLTILTSSLQGNVYLDIVRDGQTVSTRSVDVSGGRAELAIDLTPDLYGTLEIHAYKILSSGEITRDTRLIVVDQASGLGISMTPGQAQYRPGENASLGIQVTGPDGMGAKSALGLAIVDESVFALAEQDPGFAKLYFLLEQELLQPKYDLHGFSIPDLVSPLPDEAQGEELSDPVLRTAVEEAAQASLAAAIPQAASFSLQANSHQEAMQRAYNRQLKYFTGLSKGMYALTLGFPLFVFGLVVFSLGKEKRLAQSLGFTLSLALAGGLLFFLSPMGERSAWASTPLERLSLFVNLVGERGEDFWFGLLAASLVSYLILVIFALKWKDKLLAVALGLLPLFFLIASLMVFAARRGNLSPSEGIIGLGLLAIGLLPLAFLLRFSGYALRRQLLPALAALGLSLSMLAGTLPALALGSSTAVRSMQKNEAVGLVEPAFALDRMPMAAAPAMAPLPTQAAELETASQDSGNAAASPVEPPRLRQFFPETMLWISEAVTDDHGSLLLEFPVADSITTWRITALASTQHGQLGSATAGLRVFQDFFIDLDLPQSLTVGDEVSVPVGVFNYLLEAQTVRLELEQGDWFELLDERVKEMTIEANDISVVYFRVRGVRFGRQSLKITAFGSRMSDAVKKEVHVYPDGKQLTFSQSDRLSSDIPVRQVVKIPAEAIPGTQSLSVKVYPGILSQVVEGLDSILRMPYGCFEQTSSTTYPNVLVMDYLKTTGQASPETQMKAEEYINLGYQRLVTFEVQGSGGFSLFGDPPADRMLTGYGLQEFADISRVYEIDPDLVKRAGEWLMAQQLGDGSWDNDRGLVHEDTWSSLGNDRLPVTAYLAWSLVEAGFGDDARTQKSLQYLREFERQAEDPYVLALVANALVAADQRAGGALNPVTGSVLERLAGLTTWQGNTAFWKSSVATFMGSEGQTGSIETTALAALAFLRSESQPDLANAALTYLVQQKDSFGTWHSTQATVLALKALLQSVRAGAEKVNATVIVSLNGGQSRTLQVTPENFDVVQWISFEDVNPGKENVIEILVQGEGNLMYQVSGSYYLPWDKLSLYQDLDGSEDQMAIDVTYDRSELAVNDTVMVNVTVRLSLEGKAESALIDLGIPPGFAVQAEDLNSLVVHFDDLPEDAALPTIERYELTGRQILVYARNLSSGSPLQFSYRLQAKYPLLAQTPASNAYDYYNPEISGEVAPQMLVVQP